MDFFIFLIDDTLQTTNISTLLRYSLLHRREFVVHLRKDLGYVSNLFVHRMQKYYFG